LVVHIGDLIDWLNGRQARLVTYAWPNAIIKIGCLSWLAGLGHGDQSGPNNFFKKALAHHFLSSLSNNVFERLNLAEKNVFERLNLAEKKTYNCYMYICIITLPWLGLCKR
jgi:hypothetical protein